MVGGSRNSAQGISFTDTVATSLALWSTPDALWPGGRDKTSTEGGRHMTAGEVQGWWHYS